VSTPSPVTTARSKGGGDATAAGLRARRARPGRWALSDEALEGRGDIPPRRPSSVQAGGGFVHARQPARHPCRCRCAASAGCASPLSPVGDALAYPAPRGCRAGLALPYRVTAGLRDCSRSRQELRARLCGLRYFVYGPARPDMAFARLVRSLAGGPSFETATHAVARLQPRRDAVRRRSSQCTRPLGRDYNVGGGSEATLHWSRS
jgi:hypothetical protein